jgi:hypothetical protein
LGAVKVMWWKVAIKLWIIGLDEFIHFHWLVFIKLTLFDRDVLASILNENS